MMNLIGIFSNTLPEPQEYASPFFRLAGVWSAWENKRSRLKQYRGDLFSKFCQKAEWINPSRGCGKRNQSLKSLVNGLRKEDKREFLLLRRIFHFNPSVSSEGCFDDRTMKWFNDTKGFGFIEVESKKDVSVHHSPITGEGFKTLREIEEVEFYVTQGLKGL